MEKQPSFNELKKCACGHDRNHPLVVRKNKYSGWGWLGLLTGITVRPVLVRFACVRCGSIFDETDDPAELDRYIA